MTPHEIAAFSSMFSPFPGGHPWDYAQHFLAALLACPSIYFLLRFVNTPRFLAIIGAFTPVTFFLTWKEVEDLQSGDSVGWIGDGISNLFGLAMALLIIFLVPRVLAIRKRNGWLLFILPHLPISPTQR